ncbi:hypothetical protein [Natrinema salaciae]|uniref:Uncharacterized protein n=1 Tax=Natrinema salaciae TaxID=1186196 RepID=A0A1H9GL00_9EURY|nr:hypothetical protein [Natrinema salaciae]SEQ50795.1 hypothetical protein SAMN04489841_1920 [Natrinema salaciae]
MSSKNTRREVVKKGIAATAAIGALGSVGSAAAASSGDIYISVPGADQGDYQVQIDFEDQDDVTINTESGEFEWSNWNFEGETIELQGVVSHDADIHLTYENTSASVNESYTDDAVDVSIF